MQPVLIAYVPARRRRRIGGVIAIEPFVNVEDVTLLRPQQTGEGLALHATLVFAGFGRMNRVVKLVGLFDSLIEYRVEVGERRLIAQAQAARDVVTWR